MKEVEAIFNLKSGWEMLHLCQLGLEKTGGHNSHGPLEHRNVVINSVLLVLGDTFSNPCDVSHLLLL